jgi:hypothetical protein
MSQQINLYQSHFKRQEEKFSGSQILKGVMLVFVGLIIASGAEVIRYHSTSKQLEETKNNLVLMKQRRVELLQQVTALKDTDINNEIRRIEHILANRQQIQEKFQRDIFSVGKGYSEYLTAFARQHVNGLWLSGININGAGIDMVLEGQTSNPGLVPKYLRRLSKESLLAGTEFHIFQLDRPYDETEKNYSEYMDFYVSTVDVMEKGMI